MADKGNRDGALLLRLLVLIGSAIMTVSIGVNYGTLGDNLPPPLQVAAFLSNKTVIDSVKLFGADPLLLRAFSNTGILVTVTVPNGDILGLTRLGGARSWILQNISPYSPATKIHRIAVGNEVMATADKNLIAHLLPAMKSLRAALNLAGLHSVQVTTPHSLGILSASDPPSAGCFRRGYDRVIFAPMLEYHRQTKSPFMVNPYPYFGVSENTLNYALFKPNAGVFDPAKKITYTNMFDAQLDAVYSAMRRLGYGDVDIVVGETGWPSVGDADQPAVSLDNAMSYNGNLVRHVTSGKGTPLMPGRKFETFIFALFNENQKPGSLAERNFGLFQPDFTPVYNAGILRKQASESPTWCVAKSGASAEALQRNIDWVCSLGKVDCSPILANGSCFEPNTRHAHASYIMNAYYQVEGRNSYNCDFELTGAIQAVNPSYGPCKYPSLG